MSSSKPCNYFVEQADSNFVARRSQVPAADAGAGSASGCARLGGTPLIDAADLVLLEFTANDIQYPAGASHNFLGLESLEALVRYFGPQRKHGFRAPSVAIVDARLGPFGYPRASVPTFRAAHRALATRLGASVVDAAVVNGGTYDYATQQARCEAFARQPPGGLSAALERGLENDKIGHRGFGHYGAVYHEWLGAAVFYSLLLAPEVC